MSSVATKKSVDLFGGHFQWKLGFPGKSKLDDFLFEEGAKENALRPRRIVADCRGALGPSDILCLDNGIYKLWFARHYPTYMADTFLVDNALASMGAGMPSASAISRLFMPGGVGVAFR